MGSILAVANQKGGVGKTDVVKNLAGALAEQGKKLLVVDVDPQGSLGIGFGVNVYELKTTVYNVMIDGQDLQEVIQPVRDNIDLAPANIFLSGAETRLAGEYRREDQLKNALAAIRDRYDFILIDCPPSLSLLTVNALSAADRVLIPVACEYYALVGVRLLFGTIADLRTKKINPHLSVLGIVATRYDKRTKHSQEVLEDIRTRLGKQYKVFDSVIRETIRLKEAPITGKTIIEYSGSHPVADDYRNLAKEVLQIYE